MTDGDKKPEDLETPDFQDSADDFASDDFSDDMDFADETMDGSFDDGQFADAPADGGFAEGGDLSDEEWDTYDDEFSGEGEFGEAPAAPAKKKISNKMILGAAVVVGMGVLAVQLVGGGAQTPIAPSTQAPPQPTPTENVDSSQPIQASSMTDVPESDVPKAYGIPSFQEDITRNDEIIEQDEVKPGMLNNPDELLDIETAGLDDDYEYEYVYEDDVDVTEDITEAPQQPLTPIPTLDDDVQEITWGDSATEDETPRMPAADDLTKSTTTTASPFDSAGPEWDMEDEAASTTMVEDDMPAEVDYAPTNTQQSAPVDSAALNALSAKLDTLLDRIENVEDSLDKVSKMEAQIRDLSSDVKALQNNRSTSRSTSSSSSSSSASRATAPRTTTTAAPKVERSAVKWTLKSAQPGQAMVAKQGSSDVISISVGQSLAGIGTIKSIAMENGRWVVTGTSGKITQ